jgi:hypothetical protein
MTKDEALKLALETLESIQAVYPCETVGKRITAIKEALAQPEQEPAAWYRDEDGIRIYYESKVWDDATPLYTTPPQRTWVGLTDEERDVTFELHCTKLGGWDYAGDEVMYDEHFENAVAAIEAKLKEKNT